MKAVGAPRSSDAEHESAVSRVRSRSCRRRGCRPRTASGRAGPGSRAGSAASAAGRRTPGRSPCPPDSRAPPAVSVTVSFRSASRRCSPPSWMSTICRISSRPSGSNTTISSIRFTNSGRNVARTSSSTAAFCFSGRSTSRRTPRAQVGGHDHDRVAEVDRPALAVGEAAVVEQLQQHVEYVGVRLLDLVEQHHGVGPAPHRLGELPAFLVADVARAARRSAARPCAAPWYSLMSMRTMARSSSNRKSASARASSVLPTPVGPRNRNEPIGRFGRQPGARPADRVRDRLDCLLLVDDPRVQRLLHVDELLHLALHQPRDRDAGPLG